MTAVGFEPTKSSPLNCRHRPLGHTVEVLQIQKNM
jgi:hypothetical protein